MPYQLLPGVLLDLLQAQADAVGLLVDAEHLALDFLGHREDLGRVLDLLGPGHLRDVDEPLDALLQLHEGPVVGEAHHLALDARAHGVLDGGGGPGVGLELLVAQGDALALAVELEDDDLDLVPDVQDLRRVVDAAPGHVRDVEQAVDAAQVHEGPVLRDVLDRPHEDLALFEGLQGLELALGVLLLEDGLPAEDDVAPLLVDLDDAHAELLPLERVQVPHGPDVDLAPGQEGADPDVHREAALHPLDDPADDDAALLVGALHVVPDLHLLGLFLGQDDVAFLVLGLLEKHVHHVSALHRDLAVLVAELLDGDDPLRFVADVDDDFRLRHLQHHALHHLAFGEVLEGHVVHVQQALVFFGVEGGVGGGFVGRRRLHGGGLGRGRPWARRSSRSSRSPA